MLLRVYGVRVVLSDRFSYSVMEDHDPNSIPTKSGGRRGSRRNRLTPRFPPPFETRSAGSPHGSSGSGTCQPAVTPAVAAARRPPFRVAQDGGAPPLGFLSNGALQPRAPPKGTAGLRRAEAASAAERRPGRLRPLGVGRAHGDRGRAGEVRGGGLRDPGDIGLSL